MARMLVLFNHTLMEDQRRDARLSLGVDEFVHPPSGVSAAWGHVPAEVESISAHLAPVFLWLEEAADIGDYVLVQGDFGACYLVVGFCVDRGLRPVYATTRRDARELVCNDGSVKLIHVFKHVIFI